MTSNVDVPSPLPTVDKVLDAWVGAGQSPELQAVYLQYRGLDNFNYELGIPLVEALRLLQLLVELQAKALALY